MGVFVPQRSLAFCEKTITGAVPDIKSDLTVVAKGTGQTTGHIATLTVTNKSKASITIISQLVYIPSDGKYQSYVAEIPGSIIPAGSTITIPVSGNCVDVSRPAVPNGESMPPINTWIPVGDPNVPFGTNTLINIKPLPQFETKDIPNIIASPNFKPGKPNPEAEFIITWPGTDIPMGGTLEPGTDPTPYAPVIVKIYTEVHTAAEKILGDGTWTTPFSPDPEKEIQATAQQVIWICAAGLSGKQYGKKEFTTKVIQQFEENAGISVTKLPMDQKEKLDLGVTEFWNVFMATGVEAKIISVPEREGNNSTPHQTTSVPTKPVCTCTSCSVIRPMRIVNQETNEEITGDSIPTYFDQLQFHPVEIQSDCSDKCIPENSSEIRLIPHYNCIRATQTDWVNSTMEKRVEGPGYLDIETKYQCKCDDILCGEGNNTRRLYLTESNNCCDRIRCNNNGQLRFTFSEGNVVVSGNQLILNMNSGLREVFDFDFNLEAIFCNLDDNQIYSKLQTLSAQNASGVNIREFFNSQDISLDHPTDIADTRPWYSLVFAKTVDGRETIINIIIDENSCAFDLQVLYNDQLAEHASPPFMDPNLLNEMGGTLGNERDRQFWHRAMTVIGQLLRARDYDLQSEYRTAYLNFLSRLKIGVEVLQRDPAYAAIHQDLARLHALLVQAMTTGDFELVDEIFNELSGVFNHMWG
jgi:hypothetical protein